MTSIPEIMGGLDDLVRSFAQQAATHIAEERATEQAEGLTLEERLHKVETAQILAEARTDALHAELHDTRDDDVFANKALTGIVFSLVGHVLGRSFTNEEVESIVAEGMENYRQFVGDDKDKDHPLNLREFVANAVRNRIIGG